MSTIDDKPKIDDAFVVRVSSIDGFGAFLSIRVRMNNRWLYMNNFYVLPGDEIVISDNSTSGSDNIIGAPEAMLESLPHKFNEELLARANNDNA